MLLDRLRVRRYLEVGNLATLFIEELGWERASGTDHITLDSGRYELRAIAQKRGVQALVCRPLDSQGMQDMRARRAIETRVANHNREHMIIFLDAAEGEQIWQWVKREAHSPPRYLEHRYNRRQSGEALTEKIQAIAFSLEEEERITLVDVLERLGDAFTERVSKQFYKRFKIELEQFSAFIEGFKQHSEREWYASLMLNRIMFIYFIQKRGFLDSDPNYLRTRLERTQRERGQDEFITFYRYFLLRLFHDGLGSSARDRQLEHFLGDVPYFNSGLFDKHELERLDSPIDIADGAFEQLFDFFDSFDWVLDDRPMSDDREINPDVIGYVFEQYVNRKQMGAYYTKEDITGYIARNSIIPRLFDIAAQDAPAMFAPEKLISSLVRQTPDRYIYSDLAYGTTLALPTRIAAGIGDTTRHEDWNSPAAAGYGLPNETWREHVARRARWSELRTWLISGVPITINDCITFNLDIERLALDVISQSNDALLHAFYDALHSISILDPTCGSGAFLLAAVKVLEPLHQACHARISLLGTNGSTDTWVQASIDQFQGIEPSYAIRKAIVINNLYGVDIMREAVEICKLRLFLKVIAPVERRDQIEPLPDIDFNFRAGNTLVGFASHEAVRLAVQRGGQVRLDLDGAIERIDRRAESIDRAFQHFRRLQLERQRTSDEVARTKRQLHRDLHLLREDLARHLACSYKVDTDDVTQYQAWQSGHKPFQWYSEFYGVLQQGGFDVIIGNPPYVQNKKVQQEYQLHDYRTAPCGNLYAAVIERSLDLLRVNGRCGMIVPIASVSTDGMHELQQLYQGAQQWHSHYAVRPGKLFVGVDMNLTISLFHKTPQQSDTFTTAYRRWSNGRQSDRSQLFTTLGYTLNPKLTGHSNHYPKLGSQLETSILQQMLVHRTKLGSYRIERGTAIYYHSGGRYWRKAFLQKLSSHYKPITVPERFAPIVLALLNSQLFYWYWISNSNCMDVVAREVLDLPVFRLEQASTADFIALTQQLIDSYYDGSTMRRRQGERINVEERNFDVSRSKSIIDEIDQQLAHLYGFSTEQLDFVLNYDVKHRLNKDRNQEEALENRQ